MEQVLELPVMVYTDDLKEGETHLICELNIQYSSQACNHARNLREHREPSR